MDQISDKAVPGAPIRSEAIISVRGLACRRGGRRIFDNVGFELAAGQALLLTGANGSGKSTLLRALAGLLETEAGVMRWSGVDVRADTQAHAERLCLIGQDDPVRPVWTVAEHLAFWGRLAGIDLSSQGVAAALDQMGLAAKRETPARLLSAGQKRRLNLCRLFLKPRSLWLLDEPLTALDAASAGLLRGALDAHLQGGGMAVITTHEAAQFPAVKNELKLSVAMRYSAAQP